MFQIRLWAGKFLSGQLIIVAEFHTLIYVNSNVHHNQ